MAFMITILPDDETRQSRWPDCEVLDLCTDRRAGRRSDHDASGTVKQGVHEVMKRHARYRVPPDSGSRSPLLSGLCRRRVARAAGARSHRTDGARRRGARHRRSDGARLRRSTATRRARTVRRPARYVTRLLHRQSVDSPAHPRRESRIPGRRTRRASRCRSAWPARGGDAGRWRASPPTCTSSISSLVREGGEWKVSYAVDSARAH